MGQPQIKRLCTAKEWPNLNGRHNENQQNECFSYSHKMGENICERMSVWYGVNIQNIKGCNSVQPLWKSVGGSSKKTKNRAILGSSNPVSG